MRKALVGVALALWLASPAHAVTATRILYAGDWTGQMEIFAVDPTGKAPVAQLTHWHGDCSEPPDYRYPFGTLDLVPAPNGRYLLVRCGTALWLMRGDGAAARRLVAPRGPYPDRGGILATPIWSADSKRYAYRADDGYHVRSIADGGDHALPGLPPGRWIDPSVSPSRIPSGLPPVYAAKRSPDGRRLALASSDGIRILDIRTRRLRMLTRDPAFEPASSSYVARRGIDFAWAPDSRAVVYVKGNLTHYASDVAVDSGDLRAVDLNRRTRTLARADRAYGGRVTAVAWAKAFGGARYRRPDPAPDQRIAPQGLLADGTIFMLAADGRRVAYEDCNNIQVWTPSERTIETVHRAATPGTPGSCAARDRYLLYDLALSGNRVVYALREGCTAITLTLFAATLGSGTDANAVARGYTNCGAPWSSGIGRLAGSGGMVVFDDWHETTPERSPGYFTTTSATVRRLDGEACPCAALASTPGPLYPADVDGNRVVVYGDNETLVVGYDGRRLLSLAVSPAAAQLSGSELLLALRGRLLVYDARGAQLLHSWPLPDLPPGPFCVWRTCPPHALTFHDAASGLAAYTVDGNLHVLRTADGADAVVARASLARFMDDGLVYADGSRLHLVPFASLPLRGF
jgi:hypothetical protein